MGKWARERLRGGTLTAQDVERIVAWQLTLPAERIDCALLEECRLFLAPEQEGRDAPGKRAVWRRIEQAMLAGDAPPTRRMPMRRLAVLVAAALLVLLLAAAGIAAVLGWDVFSIYSTILTPAHTRVQEQASALVQADLVTVRFAHVDVTVRQALYDGHELRVLYAVLDRAGTERYTLEEAQGGEMIPAAVLDGLAPCGDWIEIDGQRDYPRESYAVPGDLPGEMLYYVQLQPEDTTLGTRDAFEVGLPIFYNGRTMEVPEGLRFLVDTRALAGLTRTAAPAQADIDGVRFVLQDGRFSPVSGTLSLVLSGKSDAELDEISFRWGAAQLCDAQGNPLGITDPSGWSFAVPGQVTVTYHVIPPDVWPEEMVLAMPDAQGAPDEALRIPIRLASQ